MDPSARTSHRLGLIAIVTALTLGLPEQVELAASSEAPPRATFLTPEQMAQLPRPDLHGRYFIGSDSTDVVIIRRARSRTSESLKLESPGEWKGVGSLESGFMSVYEGTFVYGRHPRDPRNRGVRGTHAARIGLNGVIEVEGRFTNRDWPGFRTTWTPLGGKF